MFFDRPRTWILYEPMDRDKSLLLAMTSSFITSSFPYPSPLFDLTHQMALSSYNSCSSRFSFPFLLSSWISTSRSLSNYE